MVACSRNMFNQSITKIRQFAEILEEEKLSHTSWTH
jgi:hypothetical protein